jgi:putative addiction module CopG family antidote
MPISLPPELEEFANHQIDSGRYASIEEVLVAGLRALASQDPLENPLEMGEFDEDGAFQPRSEDEMVEQSLMALEAYRKTGRSISHAAMKQWASELGN